jgi:proton glutamate symport protein
MTKETPQMKKHCTALADPDRHPACRIGRFTERHRGGHRAAAPFTRVYEFLGTIFIKALKMIIVPLIFSSIVVGITGIGRAGDVGRLGARTLAIYMGHRPAGGAARTGLREHWSARAFADGSAGRRAARACTPTRSRGGRSRCRISGGFGELVKMFERMVPENVVATASSNGDMLALIFFALLFGFFIARAGDEHAEPLFNFWNAVFHVMMDITALVMRFAPLGVFGLVASRGRRNRFRRRAPARRCSRSQ